MSTGFEREKLLEALSYFATGVKYPGWIKLLKLVYYLDLVHLRRTGRTVTGLKYNAWQMGPVAENLHAEMNDSSSDLHKHFVISKATRIGGAAAVPTMDTPEEEVGKDAQERWVNGEFKPREKFQQRYLSKREYEIVKTLAEIFHEATADQMSDVSHGKFGPWRKAIQRAKQEGAPKKPLIDLLEGVVACCNPKLELSPEDLRAVVSEREELKKILA